MCQFFRLPESLQGYLVCKTAFAPSSNQAEQDMHIVVHHELHCNWQRVPWYGMPGERSACGMPRPALRSELFFSRGTYMWLLVSNAVLRLGWLHRLVPGLGTSQGASLCFALLEVYRYMNRNSCLFIRTLTIKCI